MKGELVWTTTEDRTRLHGFLLDGNAVPTNPVDGVVIVHGLAGNFYSSGLLSYLARQFSAWGAHVVLGNTRGHDFLNLTTQSGRSLLSGAGVENVGDCRYDLPAWVNYLQQNRGCQRIALVGHSLGAIKSIFSESVRPLPAVAAVIAISATRLNHHQFLQCSAREAFVASYSIAEKMVEAGRRSELFHFEFPFPTWMSAESYMEKYGPRNEFDWTLFIEQTTKPTLMTFGERELNEHPAFEGVEEITLRLASQHDRIQFEKVDNADHFYVACFEELWGRIEPWIGKLDEEQK